MNKKQRIAIITTSCIIFGQFQKGLESVRLDYLRNTREVRLVFMRILLTIFMLLQGILAHGSSVNLEKLLLLKVGDDVGSLAKSYQSAKYSYELETKGNKLVSLDIYFDKFVESKKYLKKIQTGFCLSQQASGDFIIYRYFFFDKSLQKRFELTPELKIKNINIQDFSQANEHRSCVFEEVIKIKDEQTVRRLK